MKTSLLCFLLVLGLLGAAEAASGGWERFMEIQPREIGFVNGANELPWDDQDGPGPNGDRYFEFFPLFKATVWQGQKATWSCPCFGANAATLSQNMTSFSLSVQAASKSKLICSDLYLFATRQSWHVARISSTGNHVVDFGDWLPLEKDYVQQYGVQV